MTAQAHVSTTLRRAVASDRVGHAYLFCGPRGVGKTTLARVLAMSLNCADRSEEGEPCGDCENCRRIWAGTTALDVVEIDAASNRGVDDARDLRERAMYAPSEEGRTKVYIVDEAHMLTREAWNALLKILEEPPPRVIFIFATTEPQKIEQTAAPILSRCQRFDFRRVGVADIVTRLEEVLQGEGSEATEEALRLIARKADGGMRDALSILDQILALSGGAISGDTAREVLGVVGEDRYLQLFDVLFERDQAALFVLIQTLLDEGYDLVEFYHGLIDHLRSLLRLRVGGDPGELPEESVEPWKERAGRFQPADLVRMLGMAAELETEGSLRRTQQPRVLLELLLLRFTYLDRTIDLESLLSTLGGAPAGPPGDTDTGSRRPTPGALPDARRPESGSTPPAAGFAPTRGGPDPLLAERERESTRGHASRPGSGADDSGRREPEAELDPGSSPSSSNSPDPEAAWEELLKRGQGVPRGMLALLRGTEARSKDETTLELSVIRGSVLERLTEGDELPALESALSKFAARSLSIEMKISGESGEATGQRISVDEAREGRLRDLLAKEPGLRPAVEELDLELLD